MDSASPRPDSHVPALLCGVVVAVSLVLRAAADVGPRDAGELSAAAWTFGVSHPTGAPLCMLLQALASLLPIGSIALRQGALMAIATGVAAGCAALVAGRGRGAVGRSVSAVVVAIAAMAPTLLRAGTMTEVYAPSLALIAIAWACAGNTRSPRTPFQLGLLTALGAAAHVTARILVPIAALPVLVVVGRERGVRKAVGPYLLGVVALAPLLLEVPVAASRRTALSWGDPRTITSFFRHFMATDIRTTYAVRTGGHHLAADLRALMSITLRDLGVPLLVLGFAGMLLVALRARGGPDPRRVVAVSCVVDLAYAAFINPMGVIDRQVGHVAILALATLAASMVGELAEVTIPSGASRRRGAAAAVLLSMGAAAGIVPRFLLELRGDEGRLVPEMWTIPGALARAPARAIVICDGDDSCGGALYAQIVEGARPDVDVLPRPFLQDPQTLSLRLVPVAQALEGAMTRGDRPVLVQAGGEHPYGVATLLDRATPLVRVWSPGATLSEYAVADRFEAIDRSLCGDSFDRCTPLTLRLLAQAHLGPVGAAINARRFDDAERLTVLGLRLQPDDAALWNNRAVVRATRGDLEGALADAQHALALEPKRIAAASNVVTYAAVLDRYDVAHTALRALDSACNGCWKARALAAALDLREHGGEARRDLLDSLGREADSRGNHQPWCRAYEIARLSAPPACR